MSLLKSALTLVAVALLGPVTTGAPALGPLRVHPSNTRYFTDGSGKAVYLTGSHVWTNLQDRGISGTPPAFDYAACLDFMQARNHNFMRMWAWEQARWAPWTTGDTVFSPMPFARTGPGTALDGGAKFNLSQFNQAYFDRLRSRVLAARDRGIYVSIMLFEGWSIDNNGKGSGNPWPGHPFNVSNNINGVNGDPGGNGEGEETHRLVVAAVTSAQEAYVRKVIDTVNDLDNVLYEIANESGGSDTTAWQYHLINFIKGYEAGKPEQHPVGMTFQYPGGSNADLFNSPADWISPNGSGGYDANPPAATGAKVILTDTDHIWGEGGDASWVWKSFTRGLNPIFMDGGIETFPATSDWRNSARNAMGHTLSYANRMGSASMTPRGDLVSTGYALANPGVEYLAYQPGSGAFTLNVQGGDYGYEWFNIGAGSTAGTGSLSTPGGSQTFTPPFGGLAALYLKTPTPPPPPPPPGTGTGATGEYYDNADFTDLRLTRTDAVIDFDWGAGSPDRLVGADTFSVRWSGSIEAAYSEMYTFYTTSDDGVRLWVDGQPLIDNWTDHGPTVDSGSIALQAGQLYDFVLEYYENGGGAVAKLEWSSAGQPRGVVPGDRMHPSTAGASSGGRSRRRGSCGLLGLEILVILALARRLIR